MAVVRLEMQRRVMGQFFGPGGSNALILRNRYFSPRCSVTRDCCLRRRYQIVSGIPVARMREIAT
jgi:hypothetical protein